MEEQSTAESTVKESVIESSSTVDSEEPDAKRAKNETDSGEDAIQNVDAGEMKGKQLWLSGKWVFRYSDTDAMVVFEDGKSWVPVAEDEKEFMEQLWYEAEAAEAKQGEAPTGEVNDDFLAQYRLSYGVDYDYSSMKVEGKEEVKNEKEKPKNEPPKGPRPPGWVDMEDKVNAVYVSGLPLDITEKEFSEIMSKCGVIQSDARTNKPKLKLYMDDEGNNKGDGRCCYVRKESIDLALNILDEYELRGKKMKVERAHFEMKGDYDPKKKRRKLTAAQKKRYMEQQNKHFEWKPDKPRNYRPVSDCTVVIKKLFTIDELNENASRLFDLKNELQLSCEKFGTVKKVVVYDNNALGVATVTFDNVIGADEAVKMLNGRILRGRALEAHLWDGRTKYKVQETEEEAKKRLEMWDKFVESGGKAGEEKKEEDERKKEVDEEKEFDEEENEVDEGNSGQDTQ